MFYNNVHLVVGALYITAELQLLHHLLPISILWKKQSGYSIVSSQTYTSCLFRFKHPTS